MKKYVIGIDAGTTGTKAMVVDLKGNIKGKAYREYPLLYPQSGWVELNASNLANQVVEAVAEAVKDSKVPRDEIASLSFSVQRSTIALVDENSDALEDRFMVWLDMRADEIMDEFESKIDPDYFERLTGMPSSPIFGAQKLYWYLQKRPDLVGKAKYMSTVDGYLMKCFGAAEFCNEITSMNACGFIDVQTMTLCTEMLENLEISERLFPKLIKPGEVVGKISREIAARTGLPEDTLIVGGSEDQQAGALGAGVISDGDVSLTIGTGGFVIVGLAKPNFGELKGLMVPSTPNLGVFEVEGIQNSGATCYRWARDTFFSMQKQFADAFGMDSYNLMNQLVEQSKPGANGVVFNAALFGTAYPTWNNQASAAIVGLKATNTLGDILRAVMEGITMETRYMLESIQQTGVETKKTITVTGGSMKSQVWRQIVADMLNADIKTLKVSDAPVIGVAGLAAIGAGLFRDVKDVVKNMVHYDEEIIHPNQDNVGFYDQLFKIYKDVYRVLDDNKIYTALNQISK